MTARLLRIELRRNALLPLLPLMALLLWQSPIGRHLQPVALWTDRSSDLQSALQALGPFAAGAAAWMASREARRGLCDLLGTTPASAWHRGLTTWTATTCWAVLFYLLAGGVLFAVTATQATWGSVVIWPPLVGLIGLVAFSAVGFALGRLFPGRFTAPLAAIGTFAAMAIAMSAALNGHKAGLLSPLYPSIGLGASVFYRIRPDLGLVQITFLSGVLALALAAIGLRHRLARRATSPAWLALTSTGVTLVAVSVTLISTSHIDARGVVVPVLHDSATDRAVPYTPVCTHTRPPLCVHPAYRRELRPLASLVDKIAAPVLGLPGVPIRAEQSPTNGGSPRVTSPRPILTLPPFIIHDETLEPVFAVPLETEIALALVTQPGTAADRASPPQRAIALYLLAQARDGSAPWLIPNSTPILSAARSFAFLLPAARRSWLGAHLQALRDGHIALGQVP